MSVAASATHRPHSHGNTDPERSLRVVVVHNRYRSANPSGENQVVERDIAQLLSDGVDVIPYIRDSDEIERFTPVGTAMLGLTPVLNPAVTLDFRRLLRETRPHIVHLHNTFPLISPWVVRTAKAQRVPVVQTVHNYRHVCVNGVHFRQQAPCFECAGTTIPWPAVRHGCYQGSRLRSVPMGAALVAHRRTWELVDRFLPVGDHVAEHLRALGIDDRRIEVRRNVLEDPGEPARLGTGALFVGRLSPEKGVRMLLEAWRRSGLGSIGETLRVAGDGELRDEVEVAAAADRSIRYLGILGRDELDAQYRDCAVVVVPSLWPEPDPMAVVTALAHGRPVIGSALGSIPRSIRDGVGWTFEPNADGLADCLQVLTDRRKLERSGHIARSRFLSERHTDSAASLVETYHRLVGVPRGSLGLVGPDGAGKSAVIQELSQRAETAGVPSLHVHTNRVVTGAPGGSAAPVTAPHSQIPRPPLIAGLAMALAWVRHLRTHVRRIRPASRRGLVLVERPWSDRVVDPRRYRSSEVLEPLVSCLGRALPRLDVGVLLDGEPQMMDARKPEIGVPEARRQLMRWRVLLPDIAITSTAVDSVTQTVGATVDSIIEFASPPPLPDHRQRWLRPFGYPARLDMRVTGAPLATAATSIYPPQRTVSLYASRLGSLGARVGLVRGSGQPPVPVERIMSELGITFDSIAMMRSSTDRRWVVGVQHLGRLHLVLKIGEESDEGLRTEAAMLEMLAGATTTWRVPPLAVYDVVEGWVVLGTWAIERSRPVHARPPLADVEVIVDDLVTGRAAGVPVVHGDLTPWNMFRDTNGRWVVLDWETATLDRRPMWDLTHHIVRRGILLGDPSPTRAAAILTGADSVGARHCRAIGAELGPAEYVRHCLEVAPLPDHPRAAHYRDELSQVLP